MPSGLVGEEEEEEIMSARERGVGEVLGVFIERISGWGSGGSEFAGGREGTSELETRRRQSGYGRIECEGGGRVMRQELYMVRN